MDTPRTDSALPSRALPRIGQRSRHKLPVCTATGLGRYRDRHQAGQAVQALRRSTSDHEVRMFPCAECRGLHLDTFPRTAPLELPAVTPVDAFLASRMDGPARFLLWDIENTTHGATATCLQAAELFRLLTGQAMGLGPRDRILVGASRRVVRKYRPAIAGKNVTWVVGDDGPDGADRALLGAVDVRRLARTFDELVIASGDGAFTALALSAKAAGMRVRVVTTEVEGPRPSLSRALSDAADVRTLIRLRSRSAAASTPLPAAA